MTTEMLVIDDEAFLLKLAEPPRERNVYPPILTEFANSGNVAVDLTPRFEGKDVKNVITGMKSAAKRDSKLAGIEVRLMTIDSKDHVVLYNRTLANSQDEQIAA